MEFKTDNTTGYSQTELDALNAELDALNAELSRRLCEVDEPDRDEVAKNFADEVAGYPLPSTAPGLTVVIGTVEHEAYLMDGSRLGIPCDLVAEVVPGVMATWFPTDGGQRGTVWYWPGEGRAAVMAGSDSDWYDANETGLTVDAHGEPVDIPYRRLVVYGPPVWTGDGIFYRDFDTADSYSPGDLITADEADRRLRA